MTKKQSPLKESSSSKSAAQEDALTASDLDRMQSLLSRFGYLDSKQVTGRLNKATSGALKKFQEFHGLSQTGRPDRATQKRLVAYRCGLPDDGVAVRYVTKCPWPTPQITYAFENGTGDIQGDAAFEAVRRAFRTWAGVVPLTIREVPASRKPDVVISWRLAKDSDYDMVGPIVAHADYPPLCGYINNTLPRPLHFDDTECIWSIGSVKGAFDVETTALHEIGHVLGLGHSKVQDAVMWPYVSPNFTKRALTADDVDGIRKLYP